MAVELDTRAGEGKANRGSRDLDRAGKRIEPRLRCRFKSMVESGASRQTEDEIAFLEQWHVMV